MRFWKLMKIDVGRAFKPILLNCNFAIRKGRGLRRKETECVFVHASPDEAGSFKESKLPRPLRTMFVKLVVTCS